MNCEIHTEEEKKREGAREKLNLRLEDRTAMRRSYGGDERSYDEN
jgi:hypothetical protein